MKLINTFLVDDESDSLERLQRLIGLHCPQLKVVGSAQDPIKATQLIEAARPDLIFLDVEMPKMDGFGIISAFPNPFFKVVFVTAYDDYAIKAIKYSALDYLLKPLQVDELKGAVEKVASSLGTPDRRLQHFSEEWTATPWPRRIVLPSHKGYSIISINDILCLEAQSGGYVRLHLADGTSVTATETLQYYERLLPSDHFFRVHRSYLVQITSIKAFNTGTGGLLELSNGMHIPVSVRRKPALVRAIKLSSTLK